MKFKEHMSYQSIIKKMKQLFDNSHTIQEIMREVRQLPTMDDKSMNQLYIIIINTKDYQLRFKMIEQNFDYSAILEWIGQTQLESARMSKKSLMQLLQILEIRLSYSHVIYDLNNSQITNFSDQIIQNLKDKDQIIQHLLTLLYNQVIRSDDTNIMALYMGCICIIYKIDPNKINNLLYAQMISNCSGKDSQFYYFFISRLKINSHDSTKIRKNLLKGFLSRMKKLSVKTQLTIEEKYHITLTYEKMAEFLLQNVQSEWPEILIDSYGEIFSCLKNFLTKNFNTNSMATILNNIIKAFMQSKIKNIKKFQIVLGIYKSILQKAPKMYPFIKTAFLTDEQNFLTWFAYQQLRMQKAKQIGTLYLGDEFSMQFFLVMNIFVINSSVIDGFKIQEIKKVMRCVSLLDEAKYFMHKKDIVSCLRLLYQGLDEMEELQEFVNMVEDQYTFKI